jgi:hypothetical protein
MEEKIYTSDIVRVVGDCCEKEQVGNMGIVVGIVEIDEKYLVKYLGSAWSVDENKKDIIKSHCKNCLHKIKIPKVDR